MSGARWQYSFLHSYFGGKDMTLFHLKRLDTSDGGETLELDAVVPFLAPEPLKAQRIASGSLTWNK